MIRLCQTIASATGSPVARSQTIVVSRWFVIPIAAIRSAPPTALDDLARDRELARPDRLRVVGDVARRRELLLERPAARLATGRPSRPNAIARDDVVPWSRARIRRSSPTAGRTRAGPTRGSELDLGGLARLVPAELRAEDRGDARCDRRAAIRQLLGEPHPAGEHVVDRERELVAGRPRDLGLEVVDALAERRREVQLAGEGHHLRRLAPVAIREPARDPGGPRRSRLARMRRGGVPERPLEAGGDLGELVARRGADEWQVRRRRIDGASPRVLPERRVDHVAGHHPVGRVLAAGDPHEAARVAGDAMLARRLHGRAAGVADERPHARRTCRRCRPASGRCRSAG